MKSMTSMSSILFPVLFASSVFALQSVQLVEGPRAEELLHILQKMGAPTECRKTPRIPQTPHTHDTSPARQSVCGTKVMDVTCSKLKSAPVSSALCTLKVQNQNKEGGLISLQLKGPRASKLVEMLAEEGTLACGLGQCQGSAETIFCNFEDTSGSGASSQHSGVSKKSIQCTID